MSSLKRERRTGKEQYFTLPHVVDKCLALLLPHAPEGAVFLEPAGGTGEFIEGLLRVGVPGKSIAAFDIEPRHELVRRTEDFLEEELEYSPKRVVVSNPPFGRVNSLSVKFFNACAKTGDVIGFLVPRAWKKWSVQDRLDLSFHLVDEIEIPSVAFYDLEGVPHEGGKLQTVFQVWKRGFPDREKVVIADRGYIKKTDYNRADVSLTVFGRGCGTLKESFPREPNTTQMFLQVASPEVVEALKSVDFSRFYNNVSYTEALSIKEIMFLLNEYFDNLECEK